VTKLDEHGAGEISEGEPIIAGRDTIGGDIPFPQAYTRSHVVFCGTLNPQYIKQRLMKPKRSTYDR